MGSPLHARAPAAWLTAGRVRWIFGAILLGGLLVRALYLVEVIAAPSFRVPEVDAAYHDYWARALVTGDWSPPAGRPDPEIAARAYFRPPGYPFFLAAVYRLLGGDYLSPRLAQMALGLLNIVLAFLFARRWFGAAAGLLSAAGLAFYWAFVYFEAELLEPVLLVTLGLLLIMALAEWSARRAGRRILVAGVLAGLYAVVRPNILLFVPLSALWAWRIQRGEGGPAPYRWRPLVLLAIGTALPVLPVAIRNYRVAGDRVLISCNAGINLYIGNNEQADGVVTFALPSMGLFGTSFDYPAVARLVERQEGRPMKDSEISAYFSARAREFIGEHPVRALRLLVRKALLFWGPHEMGHNKEDHFEREFSPVLSRLPGSFALLVGLFDAGVAGAWRARREPGGGSGSVMVLLLLYIGALFASYLPFFISGRYRAPVIPFLLMAGACGIVRIAEYWRGGCSREAGRLALIGLAACGLASINFTGYRPNLAKWYYEQGLVLQRIGRAEEAQAQFRKAETQDPDFFFHLYHNIGVALAHEGHYEEAVQNLRAALHYRPRAADTLNSLGAVLTAMGKPADARPYLEEALERNPSNAEVRFNLGVALSDAGLLEEAIGQLEEAIRRRPDDPHGHAQLAMAWSRAGRLPEAAEQLYEAIRLNPEDPYAHSNLGVVLTALGRDDEALLHMREAVRLDPGLSDGWLNIGLLLARRGYWSDALEALRRRLVLAPGDLPARFYEGQALARLGELDSALVSFREVLVPGSTNAAWLIEASLSLATRPEAEDRHAAAALDWADRAMFMMAEPSPDAFNALSAALARRGRFKEAATWAWDGAAAAEKLGQTEIARVLRERAEQYRREQPWLLTPATNRGAVVPR